MLFVTTPSFFNSYYCLLFYLFYFFIFFFFFFFYSSGDLRFLHFSLHDALPILACDRFIRCDGVYRIGRTIAGDQAGARSAGREEDRKSTRLNSSHVAISYAVFCLKKKKNQKKNRENKATCKCRLAEDHHV